MYNGIPFLLKIKKDAPIDKKQYLKNKEKLYRKNIDIIGNE